MSGWIMSLKTQAARGTDSLGWRGGLTHVNYEQS
ncbi:MAG: hypothetical protein DDT21_02624 [Syntrophomonadaceae bacterium]|nr:hypothetical protein [Bacillota bacterium]